MTVYASAAPRYRDAGWPGVLPLPTRRKDPPPAGFTGANGADPTQAEVEDWVAGKPYRAKLDGVEQFITPDNVALRLPPEVIGIDFDLYKAEGRQTHARLVARCGELPPTWVSTSRDDGSGICFYRIPPGVKLRGALGGVEIIQHHHRYAVVWPSVHPEGRPYRWINPDREVSDAAPRAGGFPDLPQSWLEALREPEPGASSSRPRLTSTGEWARCVRDRFADAVAGLAEGSRHDVALEAAMALARYEDRGYPGADEALEKLGADFRARIVDRARPAEAEGEWKRIVEGARAKVRATPSTIPRWEDTSDHPAAGGRLEELTPIDAESGNGGVAGHGPVSRREPEAAGPERGCWLPDEFWAARPLLAHIRRAAHSRQRSADAVLHAVLARVAAITPHTYKLPPIVGSSASLGYFAVGIAPPGVGKSNANDIASELLPAGSHVADQLPIGSGEGLAEVLFDVVEEEDDKGKPRRIKRQVKFNAYVYVDEGQIIGSMGRREGSSLLPTLRTIWSGGTIGQTNASTERKRIVPAGQYVFGLFCGMQPGKAGALLDDADGGTPQRFAWVYASDPNIPDVPLAWPGRLEWSAPVPRGGHVVIDNHVAHLLGVSEEVAEEIRSGDRARARGAHVLDVLDGHADLLALKVAALLALLDGRLEVGEEDWRLARTVRETSDAVRGRVVAQLAAEAGEQERSARERIARRAVEVDVALGRRRLLDCAGRIAAKVLSEPERWTRRTLFIALRRWREEFDDGLEHALAQGWVVEIPEASHTGDDRRVLRPGTGSRLER